MFTLNEETKRRARNHAMIAICLCLDIVDKKFQTPDELELEIRRVVNNDEVSVLAVSLMIQDFLTVAK